MTTNFISWMLDATDTVLPWIKKNKQYMYWHAKTLTSGAKKGDKYMILDLAEIHVWMLDEQILKARTEGRKDIARHGEIIRTSILIGIKGTTK